MQGTLEKELNKDKYTVGELAKLLGFPSRQSIYYLIDHLNIELVRESTRRSYLTQKNAQTIANHVQGKRVSDADRRMVRETTEHVLWNQQRKIEENRKANRLKSTD